MTLPASTMYKGINSFKTSHGDIERIAENRTYMQYICQFCANLPNRTDSESIHAIVSNLNIHPGICSSTRTILHGIMHKQDSGGKIWMSRKNTPEA